MNRLKNFFGYAPHGFSREDIEDKSEPDAR